MSWATALVGGGAGSIIDAIGRAIDATTTSDEERLQAQLMLEKLRQEPLALQAEINKVEAAHRTIFVAGWRPSVGWCCSFALAWAYFLRDILQWMLLVVGATFSRDIPALPNPDVSDLIPVLLALLGVAGYRTYEKTKGVAG